MRRTDTSLSLKLGLSAIYVDGDYDIQLNDDFTDFGDYDIKLNDDITDVGDHEIKLNDDGG